VGAVAMKGNKGTGREAERSSAPAAEIVSVARLEIDDEIDTTPLDPASVAMEASDLVHEVSEAAERSDDADEAPETIQRHVQELDDDEDDEAEAGETIGQPVALKIKI